jgi:hypothetical protein
MFRNDQITLNKTKKSPTELIRINNNEILSITRFCIANYKMPV